MHARRRTVSPAGVVTAILLATLTGTCMESATAAGDEPIRTIEGISEHRLDNGLKILLFPDPSKPTVTVNLTIFVGSRHEGYGEAGMAHLLEHMLFKGTPTTADIPKALQARGAQFNGTTWVDRTNYYEILPAGDENLDFAIALEADRMTNSLIKGEDLQSEMTVVRNEFERGENSPASVLGQRMMSAAFEWHNYGRSTIGNRADIERVPVESLRTFYRKHYQPDNALLVVAGRFDPAFALKSIRKHFGPIPRPQRVLDATYTEEPAQDGERSVTLRRVGDTAVVGALWHIPAGPHPDFPIVEVLEGVLTSEPAGRLYKALVETKLASSIGGAAYAWHDPGTVRVMAEAGQGQEPQAVLDALLAAVDKTVADGVTEQEVDRAKQALLKQIELGASNSARIAIELSEWAAQGDWRLYFLHRDRLEKVTAEDVSRVAKQYLVRNNRTVGLFVPTTQAERAKVPATPDVASLVDDYKGRASIAVGEAFDVSPANIESRTTRTKTAGGLDVALLPKKTRGEMVNLRLTLRYGSAETLKGQAKACELLPSLMLRGTKQLSRQDLQDKLDRLRIRLVGAGQPGEATFTLRCKREQLPEAIDLLRQVLREPTLPDAELDILVREQLAELDQQKTDPQSLATNAVARKLNPYPADDPRASPSVEEETAQFKSLKPADLVRLHRDFLGGTSGQLTIVGDFDPQTTLPACAAFLDGWKAPQPYARMPRRGDFPFPGGAEDIAVPDKESATYFAALLMPVRDDHPDFPALQIGNHILGAGSLSSRLGDRVRQKEGLSYGVASGLNARSLDDRAVFYVYAICNPGNMPKVKTAIREEVDRLLKDGVAAKELEDAIHGYLQNQQVSRTEDASLAKTLEDTLFAGRTLKFVADQEKAMSGLTAEQVAAALRKHIDPKRMYVAAAGDFRPPAAAETKGEPKK